MDEVFVDGWKGAVVLLVGLGCLGVVAWLFAWYNARANPPPPALPMLHESGLPEVKVRDDYGHGLRCGKLTLLLLLFRGARSLLKGPSP